MNIEYLIEKYAKLIYKICYDMLSSGEEAEDICQETYVSLYINLEKYRNLKEDEYKNLICKIALNKCRDYLKSKQYKEKNMEDNIIQFENLKDTNKLEDHIIKNEQKQEIEATIYSLQEPYKTVIYEYYINGKTLEEVSYETKRSKQTVKMQIHRGKKILKNKYEEIRR